MTWIPKEIEDYCISYSTRPSSIAKSLQEYTMASVHGSNMLIGEMEASVLASLIKLGRVKKILELGTYTGYSALSMAEQLPPDGKVVTIDINPHTVAIANEIADKNTQLAKTNEELDRFVYSASHDMRAPLSSLLGLINLCEKTNDLAERKIYYDLMKGRINTMDGFIREITDYSRNSRMGISLEAINVKEIIQDSTQNLSYIDVHQKIRIDITPSCDVQLKTDPTRFKVIVNNLVANAYRYHRYNQEDPFIQFTAKMKDGFCYITIRDNGWGIAPEHQQRIFEMFYRASEISEGSGLGLYIVKETLEKLGGSITVESSTGSGTAFTFSLPV